MKTTQTKKSVKDIVLEDLNNGICAKDIAKNRKLDLDEVESIIHKDDRDFWEDAGWYDMPEGLM